MEEPSQRDLECFMVLLLGMHANELELPSEMAKAIGAHRKLELCLDNDQILAWLLAEVLPVGVHMYLHQGWKKMARFIDLRDGYTLVSRYDGHSQINFKVFDLIGYHKKYKHTDVVSCRTLSLPILEPRSFAAILKKSHLNAKHLAKNVHVDFEQAHGYGNLAMVVLRMAGESFVVGLKRNIKNKVVRTSFWYGWDDFYAMNRLVVGDTCFFTAIREHTWNIEGDEMWEEESTELEAKLKVEVRRMNGEWRR